MSYRETEHLRVLIANERKDRLALVAPIVAALGHEVIAREIEVEDVGVVTARERPDVALVGLGESSDHALGLIEKIVHEAACPVIALPCTRCELRQGGVQARCLCLHHRCGGQGLAELDRHRVTPLRRISRPRRRLRAPCRHRASQGHPDGTPLGRRVDCLRDVARAIPLGEPQARGCVFSSRRRPPAASEAAESACPADRLTDGRSSGGFSGHAGRQVVV
jgi:hypothetical protein